MITVAQHFFRETTKNLYTSKVIAKYVYRNKCLTRRFEMKERKKEKKLTIMAAIPESLSENQMKQKKFILTTCPY